MSNLITQTCSAISMSLTSGLVGSANVFRALHRRPLNPAKETVVPCVGLWIDGGQRLGGPAGARIWDQSIMLDLLCLQDRAEPLDNVNEAVAEVAANLETLEAANGVLPGTMDRCTWDTWYSIKGDVAVPIGALFTLKVRGEGPIKKS